MSFSSNNNLSKIKGDKVDEYLERLTPFGFSGAVLIIHNDKVILNKGYGFADFNKQIKNTSQTLFPLQSITKTFTAIAILKLQMMGKLHINDLISKYIEVPNDKKNITISQFLSHSSGIVTGTNTLYNLNDKKGFLDKVLSEPLLFAPGTSVSYSNIGYSFLAAIIEKVSGKHYEDFLEEYLFKKEGIRHTGHKKNGGKKKLVSKQYTHDFQNETISIKMQDNWNFIGNGNLMTNTNDMVKWAKALKHNRILSKKLSKKMFNPGSRFERLGWFTGNSDYGKLVEHDGGSSRGSAANFRWYQDKDTFVILFCNNGGENMLFVNNIVDKVDKIVFGDDDKVKFPPLIRESSISSCNPKKYKINDTDSLLLGCEGEKMRLIAHGNSAINLLLGNKDIDSLNDLNRKIIEAMNAVVIKNDSTAYKKYLSNSSRASFFNAIRNLSQENPQMGKFRHFEIEASVSDWMIPNGFGMTFIKLVFENGERRFRLHSNKKGILGMGGSGIPTPNVITFFPQDNHVFVGFHIASEREITLKYEINEAGEMSYVLNGDLVLRNN